MIRLPREMLQLGAHFIVVATLMSCWLLGMGALTILLACSVTGAFFHTVADTAVHPERGGRMLRFTIVSNLLFSMMFTAPMAFLLPPV